jgi:hypothetical protein
MFDEVSQGLSPGGGGGPHNYCRNAFVHGDTILHGMWSARLDGVQGFRAVGMAGCVRYKPFFPRG